MRVINSEYLSKYYNGDSFGSNLTDFSTNVVGVVQEPKKLIQTIEIDVSSYAFVGGAFDINNQRITRLAGDFVADGFKIGDEFQVINPLSSGTNTFNGKIISITAQRIDYTLVSGSVVVDTPQNCSILLVSNLYGFQMNYNFIENSDSPSYNNFIDGDTMGWYADNVGVGSTRSTAWINATELGTNKSWYNGSCRVRYVQNIGHVQQFEVEHEFIILPFYQDSELTNLQTLTPPNYFIGNKSLKYIASYDFRIVLSNPNSSRNVTFENSLGSIGWFNEPFNGLTQPFSISSLSYLDSNSTPTNQITAGDLTTINYTINSSSNSFSASTKVGLHVSFLPDLADYQRRTNTFNENFLLDSIYGIANGTPVTGLPNEIKEYSINYVSANQIDVVVKVLFADSRITNVSNYLISSEVASDGGTNAVNDKTNLIVDVNVFKKSLDVPDLWGVDSLDFELYQDSVPTNSYTSFNGWIEDTINVKFDSWLDLSKNAFLNDLSVDLVAYNPTNGNLFTISSLNVPLNGIVVNGVQNFNTNQVAGYNFLTKNDYNVIKFVNGNLVGTKQHYDGEVSIKLDWQKWINLPNADTIFYDNTKEQNGLSLNSSNYSLSNGYEIRVNVVASVEETTSGVLTEYRDSNVGSSVFDYDEDGNVTPVWSGSIDTLDSNGINLAGALLTSGVTTLRAVYSTTGVIGNLSDYMAWFGIDVVNSTSKNSIKIYNATLSISGTNLIAEYQLPSSEVSQGVDYKLSSRLRCLATQSGCSITFNIVNFTVINSNTVSFDFLTNASNGVGVSMVVKQSDGTIRETLRGFVGDPLNTFVSDLLNTNLSITGFLNNGIFENLGSVELDKIDYRNNMDWWSKNSSDNITLEFTIDCATDSITIQI